jgi:hypothetical protein
MLPKLVILVQLNMTQHFRGYMLPKLVILVQLNMTQHCMMTHRGFF